MANLKHGLSGHPLYKVWGRMVSRCHNPDDSRYMEWGGRGIQVCSQWREDVGQFIHDITTHIGERPSAQHSLDRADNNGWYELSNMRWATSLQQSRNQQSNRYIVFNGLSMLLEDWAAYLGIRKSTLHYRLAKWTLEKAFSVDANRTDRKPYPLVLVGAQPQS